ncbi:MAG: hypothetical protein ABSF81_08080 [Bacteroidales bacterium]
MRTIVITIALLLPAVLLPGQAPFPDKDEIKQFNASKTCVVLEDDPFSSYNIYIKEAVKACWKITPYDFITVKDFNVRRLNPAYSFLVITQTNFDKDKSHGLYNFLNLLQGKDVNKLGEMPEICAIPLSFAGVNDLVYSYKLGAIVSFMQKHAQKISEDPSLTLRKYLKYYNKNIPGIRNKTILVEQEDLTPEIATIDKIKAIYTSNIEIVTDEEIIKAIENKTPNTVILHKVGPMGDRHSGYCFLMLIGTDDSELYYYNLHMVDKANPDGLLPADLKRLEN